MVFSFKALGISPEARGTDHAQAQPKRLPAIADLASSEALPIGGRHRDIRLVQGYLLPDAARLGPKVFGSGDLPADCRFKRTAFPRLDPFEHGIAPFQHEPFALVAARERFPLNAVALGRIDLRIAAQRRDHGPQAGHAVEQPEYRAGRARQRRPKRDSRDAHTNGFRGSRRRHPARLTTSLKSMPSVCGRMMQTRRPSASNRAFARSAAAIPGRLP